MHNICPLFAIKLNLKEIIPKISRHIFDCLLLVIQIRRRTDHRERTVIHTFISTTISPSTSREHRSHHCNSQYLKFHSFHNPDNYLLMFTAKLGIFSYAKKVTFLTTSKRSLFKCFIPKGNITSFRPCRHPLEPLALGSPLSCLRLRTQL